MDKQDNRRRFLGRSATALAGGMATVVVARAAFAQKMGGARRHEFVMPADTTERCGTCVFWGGQRHVSRDKTEVHVRSLGFCNNPKSPNYHKMTTPETGPMKAWTKWPAVDA